MSVPLKRIDLTTHSTKTYSTKRDWDKYLPHGGVEDEVKEARSTYDNLNARLAAGGGGGWAPNTSQFVVLSADAILSSERILTGTANQITITDAGAGSTVTLSTPQDIHIGASPTFDGNNFTGVDANDVDIVDGGDYYTGTEVESALSEIGDGTTLDGRYPLRTEWLQNGFPNRTDSSVTWDDGNTRLTINPTGASFYYIVQGIVYTVSSSDVLNVNYVDIGGAEGLHVFYYDDATLTTIANPTDAQIETITLTKALVAYV